MTERLRPADMAFLVVESAEHPDAQRDAGGLRAADGRLRLRPAARAASATGSRSCRATGSGSARARAARQPGLGRRRGLRPDLPRAPVGGAAPGLDGAGAGPGRPDHVPAARPRAARCGRCTSSRASRAAASRCCQVAPDPGRRHLHDRPRPGHPRRRPRPAPATPSGWRPRGEPSTRARWPRRVRDSVRDPREALGTVRGNAGSLRAHARRGQRPGPGVADA